MTQSDTLPVGPTGLTALMKRPIRFFGNLKIGIKLGLGFGALIILALVVSVASFFTDQLEQNAFDQLQRANEAALTAERIKIEFAEARRLEQDFLFQYPEVGFETAFDRYVTPNRQLIGVLQNQLTEARDLGPEDIALNPGHARQLNDLEFVENAVVNYDRLFRQVVDKIEERGFNDSGQVGLFHQAAAAMENSLLIAYDPEFEIVLLEIRRYEKDWLLEQDLEHAKLTNNFGIQLKNQILTGELTDAQKDDLLTLLNNYLEAFNTVVALDQEIARDISELRSVGLSIAPVVDQIVTEEQRLAKEAEAEFKAAEKLALTIDLSFLILMVIAGSSLAVTITRTIAKPITQLSEVARQVAGGDLDVRAAIESQDETGQLASAFNEMTNQLQELINTLEARVAGRTRELETVMDISQRLSSILDLSDLMREVVNRTKETFNYYHVHIYLLDQAGETLFMAEGYGQAGEEMKRQAHSIPWTAVKSLVARAAREGKIITVPNVRDDPDWLPNPLLPDTYSEMAVPVQLGSEVVGVLDVQSEKINGLGQEDEAALQALANQVATAVRNARLFAETQEALYSVQQLQAMYTGQAWEKFSDYRATTDYEVSRAGLPPLRETPVPEAAAALQQGQMVELSLPVSEATQPEALEISAWEETRQPKIYRSLATPLKLRDQTLGVLGIHTDDPQRRWTEDEIALIEAVSEQMSLAIENARLFEETGRRAGRERIIADVTQQVWSSGEMEQVMQIAVEQLGVKLDASKVIIRLGTENQLLSGHGSDIFEGEIKNNLSDS